MSINIYSASQGPLGVSVYTFDGVTAPAQFVPTLSAETEMNKDKTNIQYRVRIEYPLVTTVDGVTLAPNIIRANFNFTALRNVLANTEKERVIDELIAYLTAHKAKIVSGNVLP